MTIVTMVKGFVTLFIELTFIVMLITTMVVTGVVLVTTTAKLSDDNDGHGLGGNYYVVIKAIAIIKTIIKIINMLSCRRF